MQKRLLLATIIIFRMVSLAMSAKILKFDNRREDNTSSKLLRGGKPITSPDLTLCVDFKANRVDNMEILTTGAYNDLEVEIPPTLDRFYVQVKGIFYLAPTSKITPYEFGTLCFSYRSSNHTLLFVYQGEIMLTKEDPNAQSGSKFTPELLEKLELGRKGGRWKFAGEITRLNMWSTAMGEEELKRETSCCTSEPCQSGKLPKPDILDWEETEWDSLSEKNVPTIPCLQANVPSIDVVMPIESDGVADAHEVCARLGGFLKHPNDKQDMQRVLDLVSAHLSKSDCSTGIWVPYEINQDDKWAFTDGSEESLTPDHFVPPKWLGWSLGQPNGQGQEGKRLEKCVAAYKDRPELFDTICDAIGYCYVCTFEVGKSRQPRENINSLLIFLFSGHDQVFNPGSLQSFARHC